MTGGWRIWAGGLITLLGLILACLYLWQHRILPPEDRAISQPISLKNSAFRVTLAGTSLTSRPGWPEALEPPLARCLGRDVVITRVARAGMNSRWGLSQLEQILETNPDFVTIEFSGNDADLYDGISLSESSANHRSLITGLRSARPSLPILLMVMSPKYGRPSLMRPFLPRYTALYPELAEQMDTGLLDFYPRWLARPWPSRGLQADGQHPDPKVAAEVMVPLLVAHIGRAAGKACGDSPVE